MFCNCIVFKGDRSILARCVLCLSVRKRMGGCASSFDSLTAFPLGIGVFFQDFLFKAHILEKVVSCMRQREPVCGGNAPISHVRLEESLVWMHRVRGHIEWPWASVIHLLIYVFFYLQECDKSFILHQIWSNQDICEKCNCDWRCFRIHLLKGWSGKGKNNIKQKGGSSVFPYSNNQQINRYWQNSSCWWAALLLFTGCTSVALFSSIYGMQKDIYLFSFLNPNCALPSVIYAVATVGPLIAWSMGGDRRPPSARFGGYYGRLRSSESVVGATCGLCVASWASLKWGMV